MNHAESRSTESIAKFNEPVSLIEDIELHALYMLLRRANVEITRRMRENIKKGRHGWYNPELVPREKLRNELIDNFSSAHGSSKDNLDVAIIALMLYCRETTSVTNNA